MYIGSRNVGRISERIAMNELEARGYAIIDLAYVSKTIANVDFIASKGGKSFNVQVKGTSLQDGDKPAVQYGFCTAETIAGASTFFNRRDDAALSADVVILLAVYSPSKYRAIIMPHEVAERAAQINLSRYYRRPRLDGGTRQPGKVWLALEGAKNPRKSDPEQDEERGLLLEYENRWELLDFSRDI
ncbi:hypothetical protein ACLBKU_16355 [Erythrobacter sp. NE805]|uniref:hypothetical protein n=1 Tax=Erythrobacter sp. NE805 TaxID=3389875 RepID=UPI00396B20F8